MIEGLSKDILNAHSKGLITGIRVGGLSFIYHILYVDDLVMFSSRTLAEVKYFNSTLHVFFKASDMKANITNSFLFIWILRRIF